MPASRGASVHNVWQTTIHTVSVECVHRCCDVQGRGDVSLLPRCNGEAPCKELVTSADERGASANGVSRCELPDFRVNDYRHDGLTTQQQKYSELVDQVRPDCTAMRPFVKWPKCATTTLRGENDLFSKQFIPCWVGRRRTIECNIVAPKQPRCGEMAAF